MAIVHDQALIEAAQRGDRAAIQRLLVSCQLDLRRGVVGVRDARGRGRYRAANHGSGISAHCRAPHRGLIFGLGFRIVRREYHRLPRHMRGRAELPDDNSPTFAHQQHLGLQVDLAAAIESLPHKYRVAIILPIARKTRSPKSPTTCNSPPKRSRATSIADAR